MKKRKIYEISVIDKTYSKTISDETKFYTSDTALELGFELKETEYNFESVEIVLFNIDDRSLVTRQVSKIEDGFAYELEDDITAHYGEWRGQVRFEQAGEIYVSSPVKFRIENDLSSDRPPQLSDVQSWVSLKRYADGLIDELKQAVLSIEGIEDAFNENETIRQTTFEVAESERDATFNTNEGIRQTKELEREEAEAARQTTFTTNEATRQEKEEARELAEDERENAESQRKIDHANRSSELAGKANKKQEDWITATLINGAVGKVQYRKDEFGMVHIQGSVSIPNSSLQPFLIPFGYRPRQTFSNAVTTRNNNNMYRFTMGASGSSFLNISNTEVDLTGVNFEAGG